jgi:hypothetical protein
MVLTREGAITRSTSKPEKEKKKRAMVDPVERAKRWAGMIDGVEIRTRADLARHLGVSRARVTQVLSVRGVRGGGGQGGSCASAGVGTSK